MPSAPYHLSISAARSGALFASPLQRSDEPSARQVQQAIAMAISVYGVRGCAARVAQAYGEHPETARIRMRWALAVAASAFAGSPAEPAPGPAPGHSTVPGTAHAAYLILLDSLSAGRPGPCRLSRCRGVRPGRQGADR